MVKKILRNGENICKGDKRLTSQIFKEIYMIRKKEKTLTNTI